MAPQWKLLLTSLPDSTTDPLQANLISAARVIPLNHKSRHSPFPAPSFPFLFLFWLFIFLGPHPWHMEVPWIGVESEL